MLYCFDFLLFFFNDTATTEIYTLSLHDALPTSPGSRKSRFTPMRMAKNNTSPHEDRLRRRPRAEPPHGGRPVRRRLARGPAGRRPRARGLAVRRGAPAGAGHHDGGIRPF